MKKSILLLLTIITMFVSSAVAQEGRVKYYGEVFVAGDASWANMVYSGDKVANNDVLMYGTSLHTIHGVKIGDKFSLGLGVGIDILLGMDEEDYNTAGQFYEYVCYRTKSALVKDLRFLLFCAKIITI